MLRSAFDVTPDDAEYLSMREEFLQVYERNLCVDSRLFPGMPELLSWLEAGGIAWGVVTNKYERLARPIIECFGLGQRAAVVVGGDTCKRAKPFPDPLLHAIEILGVPAEHALYVGDDERDVQAARAAGMPVIVAGYGYLGDGPAPELWGSDGIIVAPEGVQAWIEARVSREIA